MHHKKKYEEKRIGTRRKYFVKSKKVDGYSWSLWIDFEECWNCCRNGVCLGGRVGRPSKWNFSMKLWQACVRMFGRMMMAGNKKHFTQKFKEQPTANNRLKEARHGTSEGKKKNRKTHTFWKRAKEAKMKIINRENKHTLTEYQIMSKFRVNAERNKQLSRDKAKKEIGRRERKREWQTEKSNVVEE